MTQELKPGKMIERMKVRRHTEVAGLQDIIRTLQSQLAERERELAEAREVTPERIEATARRIWLAYGGITDCPDLHAEWERLADYGHPDDGLFKKDCMNMAIAALEE